MSNFIINKYGTKQWLDENGMLHRDNDEPAEIYSNGDVKYYIHGDLHRDNDQPAIIFTNGTKFWAQHGDCHRDNFKPAAVFADGREQYWVYGQLLSQEVVEYFKKLLK